MPETERRAMRSASGRHYRAKNYLKAIAEGEQYLNRRPADTEFMRFFALPPPRRQLQHCDRPCRRLWLRLPEDTRNLKNLAAMHAARRCGTGRCDHSRDSRA
ncbi:MAG: hypothetical protein U1F16_10120 [Turneriella sp.]